MWSSNEVMSGTHQQQIYLLVDKISQTHRLNVQAGEVLKASTSPESSQNLTRKPCPALSCLFLLLSLYAFTLLWFPPFSLACLSTTMLNHFSPCLSVDIGKSLKDDHRRTCTGDTESESPCLFNRTAGTWLLLSGLFLCIMDRYGATESAYACQTPSPSAVSHHHLGKYSAGERLQTRGCILKPPEW